MSFFDWYSITREALEGALEGIVAFVPSLIGAMFVFIVGWFVAVWAGKLVAQVLNKLKFNRLFEKESWRAAFEKAGLKVNASEFVGEVVKWILMVAFLLAAVEILGLTQFAGFLSSILAYLDNVVVAALIFIVTVVVVDIVVKVIVATGEGARFAYSHLAGEMVKWAIWTFAILAILHQLGIAQSLIEILFTGIVAVLVVSAGLAFGLGGKEIAAEILNGLKQKIKG